MFKKGQTSIYSKLIYDFDALDKFFEVFKHQANLQTFVRNERRLRKFLKQLLQAIVIISTES